MSCLTGGSSPEGTGRRQPPPGPPFAKGLTAKRNANARQPILALRRPDPIDRHEDQQKKRPPSPLQDAVHKKRMEYRQCQSTIFPERQSLASSGHGAWGSLSGSAKVACGRAIRAVGDIEAKGFQMHSTAGRCLLGNSSCLSLSGSCLSLLCLFPPQEGETGGVGN